MSYQPQSTAPQGKPGKGVLWLGVLVLIAGLAGAVATFVGQRVVYEQSVENLERALPGYRTELEFERDGTFSFYYEHQGSFTTRLDGQDTEVTLDAPETPPEFDVRLLDGNGEDVRLRDTGGDVSYDVGGFAGSLYRQVDIDDAGRYTLEIVPDADGSAFALAVGKGTVEEPSVVLPLVIGLIGFGVGLGLILLGQARRSRARRAAVPPAGYGTWPEAGPGQPPSVPYVPPAGPPPTAPVTSPPVTGPPVAPPAPPLPPPATPAPAPTPAPSTPPGPAPTPDQPRSPWGPPQPPASER